MYLLADENLEQQVVRRLREDGYEVLYVAEMEPGITDEAVLSLANSHGALLLTTDKDFGELVVRQGLTHSGVALLRLAGLSPETKAELVSQVLQDHLEEMQAGFTVIMPSSVRIRRNPDTPTS